MKKVRVKTGKLKQIAIVLWCDQDQEIKDLYYYSLRSGIVEEAKILGYESQLYYDGDPFNFKNISGIVAIGHRQYSRARLNELQQANKPLVFVDADTLNEGYPCVISDFHTSIKTVIDHFLKHQQTSIGMLAGELAEQYDKSNLADFRFQDYKRYLTSLDLFDLDKVYVGKFTPDSGYAAMKKAIAKGQLPQALVVANDAMAIGALKALREKQLKVPEDLSIISFNDTTAAEFANPSLSSVRVNTNDMGKMGMQVLQTIIENEFEDPFKVVLPTKLILRESSLN